MGTGFRQLGGVCLGSNTRQTILPRRNHRGRHSFPENMRLVSAGDPVPHAVRHHPYPRLPVSVSLFSFPTVYLGTILDAALSLCTRKLHAESGDTVRFADSQQLR